MQAQREVVAVSSHGRITGNLVGPKESDEFRRFRKSRQSCATAERAEEIKAAIGAAFMDAPHTHLDATRDPK
jgi:hypothetical protein